MENDAARIALGASGDLSFGRAAAATFQLGGDAGAPIAQILQSHGGVGTNIAGASLAIAGGRGTGNAVGGAVKIQVSPGGASGSSQNTLVTGIELATGSGAMRLAFFGGTPVAKQTHIADPAGGVTVDAEARTAINAILVALENYSLLATS
jgi:hypothetical protein